MASAVHPRDMISYTVAPRILTCRRLSGPTRTPIRRFPRHQRQTLLYPRHHRVRSPPPPKRQVLARKRVAKERWRRHTLNVDSTGEGDERARIECWANHAIELTLFARVPRSSGSTILIERMNGAVICLSVVIGLVFGGLLWWIKRSFLAALMVPVVVVGLVALALPPAVAPVGPPPDAAESEQVTSEVQDDLPTTAKLAAFRPIEVPDHGYVASDACRECHPQNHATWFASYHRTMTQVAQPDVVLGDFNDVKLSQNGRDYHLREVDDVCWVEMLDPAAMPGTAAASSAFKDPL